MSRTVQAVAIVATLLLAGGASGAHAQSAQVAPNAESLQAAQELMSVLGKDTIRQMAEQITTQVWPKITHSLQAKQSITPDQLNDLRKEYNRIQIEFMTNIMADAPVIYARHFTAAELRELLAFYRTPVGEKSIRVLPQITAETLALVVPRMQQIQTEVMNSFSKVLRQRGFNI
ncbi:DUF2059 domain-containing protein [Microbacteriaceae bacterium K1510]|nr:DUF2059 domain-containing protein [Microbacteriaceae bacterium K1510]